MSDEPEIIPASPPNPKRPAARLTVVESVYHSGAGRQARGSEARFSRWLGSDEQVWERHTTVGEAWAPLDRGWVERAALLKVANDAGKGAARVPTPARQALLDAAVVELGVGPAGAGGPEFVTDVLRPGESVRRLPPDLACLWLRCRAGTAAVTIVLIPD